MIYSFLLHTIFKGDKLMKKALPTIVVTFIFLAVIASYAWGVVKVLSEEATIETMMIPFIILAVFSIISVLIIVILIRRVKAINEEENQDYDDY